MAQTTLELLLQDYARELNEQFNRASKTGKGAPSEVADRRENAVRHLLQRLFPYPYFVVKGQISDAGGATSHSIDAIIVNPAHPRTIDSEGKFELIFADGVDCAIEVKPDLSRKAELRRGLEQLQSVKQRRRTKSPLLLPSERTQEELSHSLRIPTWLFSTRGPSNVAALVGAIRAAYRDLQVPLDEQLDFVVVHQRGIVCNYKLPSCNPWNDLGALPATGYFFEEWGASTLAGMILHINYSAPAVPRMTQPLLTRYLKHLKPAQIRRFDDPA